MLRWNRRPIVFGAGSLALVDPRYLSRIDVRPPVRRGDLENLAGRPPGTALILDGLFGASLAVTPTECRELMYSGWTLAGASSMGALRASEMWQSGMIGFGDVYNLLRIGVLRSDADVAVVLCAESYRELTMSMVHIRSILTGAERSGLLDLAQSRRLMAASRRVYWPERSWEACRRAWRALQVSDQQLEGLEALKNDAGRHPKARDGRAAVHTLLADRWVSL